MASCSLIQRRLAVVAADPAEIVLGQAEQRAVVDHAAVLIADGRVVDLPDGQLADVARKECLAGTVSASGPRISSLRSGERSMMTTRSRQAQYSSIGAGLGELCGTQIAAVFAEVAGKRATSADGSPVSLGELQGSVGCHAVSDRALEGCVLGIDPDLDFGQAPAIGGIDVARAGRGGADKVGQRPHQHVVAGPRPGLVEPDGVLRVDIGVVEKVDRRPAAICADLVGGERAVEIVRAVGVAEIAHVLIVAGGAGEIERVVPADGVLHDLDQRIAVAVEELARTGRAWDRRGR